MSIAFHLGSRVELSMMAGTQMSPPENMDVRELGFSDVGVIQCGRARELASVMWVVESWWDDQLRYPSGPDPELLCWPTPTSIISMNYWSM